jgi:hypothetical protein
MPATTFGGLTWSGGGRQTDAPGIGEAHAGNRRRGARKAPAAHRIARATLDTQTAPKPASNADLTLRRSRV